VAAAEWTSDPVRTDVFSRGAAQAAPFFAVQNESKITRAKRLFDMNVQLPVHMNQQAFLDWAEGQEERYELNRGRVIMMTGGTRAHWQIAFNLAKALEARVDLDRFAVLPNSVSDRTLSPYDFPMSSSISPANPPRTKRRPRPSSSLKCFPPRPNGSIWATRPPNTFGSQVFAPIWSSPRMK
jgi:hypothetical protein